MLRWLTFLILWCRAVNPLEAQEPIRIPDATVKLLHDVQVSALDAGMLSELLVHEGDQVTAGQLLGRIDQSLINLEANVARLQWQVAQVQAQNDINLRFAGKQREVSAAELERSRVAIQSYAKSISKTELDELRLVAERSLLAVEQADLELSVARLTEKLRSQEHALVQERSAHREIRAPLAGIVLDIVPEAGEWLQPGSSILRVVQLDRLRVEALVDGSLDQRQWVGRSVQFRSTFPPGTDPTPCTGKIEFVSPEVEPVTGQMRLWAVLENSQGTLRPGVRGTLEIDAP